MNRIRRFCDWAGRTRYPLILLALAAVLGAPSLMLGLHGDDFMIREVVRGTFAVGGLHRCPLDAFSFLDGVPDHNRELMDRGWLPWWSDPTSHLAFFRPLASLTHWVDHHAWPGSPALMHVQSVGWFVALVWAVAALYRRLIGRTAPAWVAVLAALLFTLDDAHAWPVAWLANRNVLLAGLFGVLALVAHDRWRRDGWRPGALLAPLAFAAGLLAKEATACVGAYLLAYALFLDRGRWARRALSLLPCVLVGAGWFVAYRLLGYGLRGSAVYLDPYHSPAAFLLRVARDAPILLLGQWGLPSSDTASFWSAPALGVHVAWAVVYLCLVGVLMAPLVRTNPLARFWTLGMALSVLPGCAAFTHDRLLVFAGIGGSGLLAMWLGGMGQSAAWLPAAAWWRRLAAVFRVVFVGVHLVLAPLGLVASMLVMAAVGPEMARMVESLPAEAAFAQQTAIHVNSLSTLTDALCASGRRYRGLPVPAHALRLNASCSPATLTRVDERTLVVRPAAGYLLPRGAPHVPGRPAPTTSLAHLLRYMDILTRDAATGPKLGERIELPTASIEITALTADGRPAEATFRFRQPLEHPSLRWFALRELRYVPFAPPAIGKSVRVPSPAD